jgi:amphi-Trp domain-containing protein
MGKEVVLFKSEEKRSLGEIADFLHQLAERVEAGQVILRQGAEELTLDLPGMVTLEVKAEEEASRSGLKHSLEVELEWKPGDGKEQQTLELG